MLAENFLLGSMSYRVYLLNSLFGVFFVYFIIIFNASNKLINLVHTTQVNSTFCWHGLASLEVISQVLFTSEQPWKNKMAFVSILSKINLGR